MQKSKYHTIHEAQYAQDLFYSQMISQSPQVQR